LLIVVAIILGYVLTALTVMGLTLDVEYSPSEWFLWAWLWPLLPIRLLIIKVNRWRRHTRS
jgi:hypothetical protein